MCTETAYTLRCEHVVSRIMYCAEAPAASSTSTSSSSRQRSSGSHGHSHSHSHSRSTSSSSRSSHNNNNRAAAAAAGTGTSRKTCGRVIRNAVPWPPPPEFGAQAAMCPLGQQCPFEARGGLWNCCWCGKEWNELGRCSCVMIIDRQEYRCEHICCETCEAATEA